MKENVISYLKDKVGVDAKARCIVVDSIFGERGILNSEDEYQFEERCADLVSEKFVTYFRKTLRPKLMLNYQNLGRTGPNSASCWTNNNAESIQHIMKIDAN